MKIRKGLIPFLFAAALTGCSDEAQEKWSEAGRAVKEAGEETAKDVKEGASDLVDKAKAGAEALEQKAQEVIQSAKATDPDTGEVIRE